MPDMSRTPRPVESPLASHDRLRIARHLRRADAERCNVSCGDSHFRWNWPADNVADNGANDDGH